MSACNYLDIVPENTPTIEHAFANRSEVENYLAGIYSFLPQLSSTYNNPALTAGDEIWFDEMSSVYGTSNLLWQIAQNRQGTQNPLANYFSSMQEGDGIDGFGGYYGGLALFTALSDCNIFFENVHRAYDLGDGDRKQWTAEVKFLKAYFHFWLMRMYGPIPVIRENIDASAGLTETQKRQREPIDNVVNYIVQLLDEALPDLEDVQENRLRDLGRPTQTIALAFKAQVLTYAASPLFNGNTIPIFANYTNADGVKLFPEKDDSKWQTAAEALRVAINAAHANLHRLYDFRTMSGEGFIANLSKETIDAMQVRGAVTEPWNDEIVWGDTKGLIGGDAGTNLLQRVCLPAMTPAHHGSGNFPRNYAPPLRIVEQFYSKNGIPIDEDKDWANITPDQYYELRTITYDDRLYFHHDEAKPTHSAKVNFDREARFYGSICFAEGTYYGFNERGYANDNTNTDTMMHFVTWDPGFVRISDERYSVTGYLVKKLVNYKTSINFEGQEPPTRVRYPFPAIRLADLYLMYAEALNEATPGDDNVTPNSEAYKWIDTVRARSGLKGVKESWATHAKTAALQNKPLTKGGLREIIQRERLIELAFEGARFWDLRRWLKAKEYMNGTPVRGLNAVQNITYDEFYKVRTLFTQTFEDRHYFWPIKVETVLRNPQLKQSPGWETGN
jgi:hypothetical protein